MKCVILMLAALAVLLGGVGQSNAGFITLSATAEGTYADLAGGFGTDGSGTPLAVYLTGSLGGGGIPKLL
jgi:hypothetical protein